MRSPLALRLAILVLLSGAPAGAVASEPAPGSEDRFGTLQTLVIRPGESVNEVVCYWCRVRVEGSVQGDVVSLFGGVEVEGSVGGDVVVVGGAIRVGPKGAVGGDAIAIGGPVEQAAGARIDGESVIQWYSHLPGQRQVFFRGALVFLAATVLLILVAHLIVRRRRAEAIAAYARRRWLLSLTFGAAVTGLAILLFNLFEYLPTWEDTLSPLLAYTLMGFYLFGLATMSSWVGTAASRRTGVAAVAYGAALLAVLMLIPVAGTLVFLLAAHTGLGATLLSRFGSAKRAATVAEPDATAAM